MTNLNTRDPALIEWRIQIWPRVLASLNNIHHCDSRFKHVLPYFKEYFFSGKELEVKERDRINKNIKINSDGMVIIPKSFRLFSADVLDISDVEKLFSDSENSNEYLEHEVFMWGFSRSGYDEVQDEIDRRVQHFKLAHTQFLMTLPLQKKAKRVVEDYINNVYRNIYFHNESAQFLDDDFYDEKYRLVKFQYFEKCLSYIVNEAADYTSGFLRQLSLLNLFLENEIYHFLAPRRLVNQVTTCVEAINKHSTWLESIGYSGDEYLKKRKSFGQRSQNEKASEGPQPGFNNDGDWIFDSIFEPRGIVSNSELSPSKYLDSIVNILSKVKLVNKENVIISVSKVDISSLLSKELKAFEASTNNFEAYQIPIYFDWPFNEVSEEKTRIGIKLIILKTPIKASDDLTVYGLWLPECSNDFLSENWYLHMRNYKRIILSLAKKMQSEHGVEHLIFSNENRDDEESNEIYRKYRLIYYPGFPLVKSELSYNKRKIPAIDIIDLNSADEFYGIFN